MISLEVVLLVKCLDVPHKVTLPPRKEPKRETKNLEKTIIFESPHMFACGVKFKQVSKSMKRIKSKPKSSQNKTEKYYELTGH